MSLRLYLVACFLLHLVTLVSTQDSDSIPECKEKSLKFCANLSFLFQEVKMLERWSLAKQTGFKAVEAVFLYDYPLEEVVRAKETAGVEHILLNVYPGDESKGEFGFAAIPGKKEQFQDSLHRAITYCKALKCKVIHLMEGIVPNPTEENDRVYEENIRWAAGILEEENIVGVIEPVDNITVPNYYMNSYVKGLNMVKKINSPYIRLMADTFHWKMMDLDLTESITEAFPYIGHIQMAQAPGRHEPDSCGTIDYKSVLALLKSLGYNGWIAAEYYPIAGTIPGLKWIKEMGYCL